ncbi:hypothetical protein [Halorussus lipolyticus]|uniref:hypothetical protein n=1 Tax=Halorussus lipolyticus TaxID=3034024 RepID=UPI0023E7906E|nr:hypothetical protein [Halorussus sp. DT80]
MDISSIISSIRLAQSITPEQESTSDTRRNIFDAVAGQEISFTPEVGEQINLQLRNCAFDDEEELTYLTVSVSDPNRPNDLFQLETDMRYHYLQIYMKRSTELGNPLVRGMNFVELGPEDFKVELKVESTDPPTLQLAFERIEKVLAQVHTEYHQFLRSMYEEHKDEFDVTQEFKNGQMRYTAKSNMDNKEMIPQPGEDDFEIWTMDRDMEMHDRITISHYAYDYVKYAVGAEAGGDNYFVLS